MYMKITECGFMDRNYLNIEQSDIDLFYQNFCLQHPKTATHDYKHLAAFLKEFYPEFEINFDDEDCLSAADYVYSYSLLLHFSCVKHPETAFHDICKRLPDYAQLCIAEFFKLLLDAKPVTREAVRHAIAEVASIQVTPPRLNESFSSGGTSASGGGLSSASFSRSKSPLKTPKHGAGPHRISPSTPKSYMLEERTKELYHLRAQLETERYEKSHLEVQIIQNEDEIQKINNDRKRLLQQIQDLKNELLLNTSDSPTNRDGEEKQIKKHILKELSQKEQQIIKLSDNVRTLSEEKSLMEKKLNCAEKQFILFMDRIKELDFKVDELSDNLKQKNDYIKYLNDNKIELEKFISETRSCSSGANLDFNASGDCLDNSFLRTSNNTNGSNSLSSPENLGVSVVDVQLREKEHENHLLKEQLNNIQREHKRLAKHLIKLTQEFELPIDTSFKISSEGSESDTEREGNSSKVEMSCEEQFNILTGCVEKIDKFHKTERNKIRQLEQQSYSLRKENEGLRKQLSKVTEEVEEFKEILSATEKSQQELEKFKLEVETVLEKTETDLLDCEKQKTKLYTEVKSLQSDKEKLNENIQQLKTKLELQHQESKKLLSDNKKLYDNEQILQTQLQELQNEFSQKTLQWDEKFKHLSEKIIKHREDIDVHKQTEQKIKCNYEQMVVKNEELKKEARQANAYLCDMRNKLKEKENQLSSLGQQIEDFKQKNKVLEQNFNLLMEEHKQEMLTNSSVHSELTKLKDQLNKTELLMHSRQHECELKRKCLEEVKAKVSRILNLFTGSNKRDDEDILSNIEEIITHIENMLENNGNIKSQVSNLQERHEENSTEIEKLTKELHEKSHDFEKNQKELMRLKADNLVCEKKVEYLLENEKELQDRLNEAFSEHETFMERITVELKLEKQHHNEKEMELIISKAECNEAKKKLNEAEQEIQILRNNIKELQQNCERLKQFESRVVECSGENNQLRNEIEAFKQQVTQNAMRLVEADKALMEFMELTKEQNAAKSEMDILQNKLKQKESTLMEMELKLQEQYIYEQQLKQLKPQLEEQTEMRHSLQEQVEKLGKDKERLVKEAEEKVQQILREQQDKMILLTSLEESTDQLKLAVEEKEQQSAYLEKKLQEQYDSLTLQNTKLQGDLVEREAELQQEKEDYQQKLALQTENLSEKSEKLRSIDISLMEIVAIMETNFNLIPESLPEEVSNAFNYQENKSDKNVQKLRNLLNHILLKQRNLNAVLQELTAQKEEAVLSVATLKDGNSDLLAKLSQQENTLRETQEKLENEKLILEKRVFQEVKRLEEDTLNLEKVNERLANENVKIQVTLSNIEEEYKDSKLKIKSLQEEILQLREEAQSKSLLTLKLQQDDKKLRQTLKEKSQQIEKLTEKLKNVEAQLKDKAARLQNLEKEYQEAKSKAQKNQQNQQVEHKKLQEKLKLLQTSSESLEIEVGNKNKELLVAKNENAEHLQQQQDLEQQLNLTFKKLDDMLSNKLNAETKCEQLKSELQQLKRDLDFAKAQQQTQQEETTRLNQEIKALKVDKQHLRDEVHENKLTLQRANDNVTQLIQQISSILLEKEAALEENLLLRKQQEETGKSQSSSETRMKSIMEKSQDLERKLLTSENELKSLKVNLEKSANCAEKLQAENKKLRDSQEVSTKRIEKLSIKLGDSQARSTKLERDNEKLGRTLEAHAVTVEALQKEKDLLQAEAKSLKERLSRAERGYEQLAAKVQNLEHLNTSLQQIKQKLEASEIDGKIKLNKLEKMRETSEEKIRRLTNSLNNAENVNVKLNLEIGALNSQLNEVKVERNQEHSTQIVELNHKYTEALELNHKYEEINEKLKIELDTLKEENSSLNDQLSKASISLQMTSQKCDRFVAEMEQIRSDMLVMRQEKSQIELQHETSIQKINQFELQNTKIVYESKNLVKALEQKISQLEEELAVKMKKIVELQKENELLNKNSECQNSLTQNATASLTELEDLRTKLSLAEENRLKEQQIISQLHLDNQILHTKYKESKQRALDAAKSSEDRIMENRLELEGKLEKMKNKMKTLFTEEITKMKNKQEREMALVKTEMEVLKAQNTKYEEHTRKLSSQIVRLNDNILEYQKENTILSTKLKHVMDQLHERECNKRPTSIHVSTISSSTAPVGAPNIGPNLAMEDEEGEVFNNTYLTDLKNGHMPELMSRDVCVEELKYRNSLLPPHLRSAYAAQFDHELAEDDLKDGPHSLDDSMCALLSTTAGGTRKKCSGVTHYKRPGPPTPSKNGRLSLGGNSEPLREILKESYDLNAGPAVSSKTPARFNFFTSRFSMGNTRDENTPPKRRLSSIFKRK